MTRKWDIVNDQSNTNYVAGNEIIHNTEVLKSNQSDISEGVTAYCVTQYHSTFVYHWTTIDEPKT